MNFIKKLVEGKVDEDVHRQFTRFGKGEYRGRFLLSLWKTKKIKINIMITALYIVIGLLTVLLIWLLRLKPAVGKPGIKGSPGAQGRTGPVVRY